MRTSYPVPSFSDGYQYKIVDSTFIHAVHLARSKWSSTLSLGVSLLKDQDTILWYIVKEPLAIYHRLTDPKQSPGFVFNNSVKGKQSTRQSVSDKPQYKQIETKNGALVYPKPLSSYLNADKPIAKAQPKKVVPSSHIAHGKDLENHVDLGVMSVTQVQSILKQLAQAWSYKVPVSTPCPVETYTAQQVNYIAPKENKLPEPSRKEVEKVNASFSYGAMLDVYHDCGKSSCISYLALGYNKAAKGLVVYYSLNKSSDVYVIETDDITLYRDWIESDSLGKFYNECIRYGEKSKLLRSCAK